MRSRRHNIRLLFIVCIIAGAAIVVGGAGFIGGASADTTSITTNTTGNVEIGETATTQNTTFDLTVENGTARNVTLNVSSADDNGSVVSLDPSNISFNNSANINIDGVDNETDSKGSFNITVNDTSPDGPHQIFLTSKIVHDTTAVTSTPTGLSYKLSNLTGSASATDTYDFVDTTPPTFDSATRKNTTAINATLSDSGVGLNPTTIEKSDFKLTNASLDTIEKGTIGNGDSTGNVTLNLANTVDNNTVTITIQSDIDDTDGNSLSSASVAATGMDGVAPTASFTNPSEGDNVQSQDFINGTATDGGTNIKQVNLTIQRDSDNNYWNDTSESFEATITNLSASADDGSFGDNKTEDWFFDSSAITGDDSYTVKANATDTAGNRNVSSATVNYTLFTPDSSSVSSSSSSSSAPDTQYAGGSSSQTRTIQTDGATDTSTVSFSDSSSVASVTFGAEVSGSVKSQDFSSEPSDVSSAPGRTVSVSEIAVPEDATDTSATIRTRVSTDRLDDIEADASNLRVARYNEDVDEWNTLTTEIATQNSERVVLEAETPGFSLFTVSAIEEDTSDDGTGETDTDSDDETETDTDTSDGTAEETGDGIPGFGISVALASIVAIALFARRRQS